MATERMGEKNLMARKSGANGTLTICRPQENGRQTMKLPYPLLWIRIGISKHVVGEWTKFRGGFTKFTYFQGNIIWGDGNGHSLLECHEKNALRESFEVKRNAFCGRTRKPQISLLGIEMIFWVIRLPRRYF